MTIQRCIWYNALLAIFSSVLLAGAVLARADLVITEYWNVGDTQVLELYNSGDEAIQLDQYTLRRCDTTTCAADAATAADTAATAADVAATAAANAKAVADQADAATTAAGNAETAKDSADAATELPAAKAAAGNAADAAIRAATAAIEATTTAGLSNTAKSDAEAAKSDAEAAKSAAENASSLAGAQKSADDALTAANKAAGEAETARTAANTAKTSAENANKTAQTANNAEIAKALDWKSLGNTPLSLPPKKTFVFVSPAAHTSVKNQLKDEGEYKEHVFESPAAQNLAAIFNGEDNIQLYLVVADKDGNKTEALKDQIENIDDSTHFILRRRLATPSSQYRHIHWAKDSSVTEPEANESFDKDQLATLGDFEEVHYTEQLSCDAFAIDILNVQGTKDSSPEKNQYVVIEGEITLVTKDGFFLQKIRSTDSRDPSETKSEGIFIDGTTPDDYKRKTVKVRGIVREHYNQTQIEIENSKQVQACNALADSHGAKAVSLPDDLDLTDLEKYEGMKVKFTGTISKTYGYNYDSYQNDMILVKGNHPHYKPTQVYRPESKSAKALEDTNKESRITLKSTHTQENGVIDHYPQFNPDTHPLGVGTQVHNIPVVVGYNRGEYFFYPVGEWEVKIDSHGDSDSYSYITKYERPSFKDTPKDTPPARPHPKYLRIASQNLLNFFTNNVVESAPALPEGQNNRGARSSAEFALQREKLVHAIRAMDADIIGFMEVGNNGAEVQSALGNLTASLNFEEEERDKHYSVVFPQEASHLGSDAISVGLVYRASVVTPKGDAIVLEMPKEQTSDGKTVGQRDSLVQTFCRKSDDDPAAPCVTVAVNHFKSKRCSGCADDQTADTTADKTTDTDKPVSQGCCNNLRVSAAVRLGEYMNEHHSGEGENVILLGDFNAYAKEDPVHILTTLTKDPDDSSKLHKDDNHIKTSSTADFPESCTGCAGKKGATLTEGYGFILKPAVVSTPKSETDPEPKVKPAFSYSYNGELGKLDHFLVSSSLKDQVEQVTDWHINSLENSLFEYSARYSGDLPKSPGPYSCSDHDPVIVDIDLK